MEVEALMVYWVEREYTDKKTGELKWYRAVHVIKDREVPEEGYGTPCEIISFRGNKSLNYLPKDRKPHRVKLKYEIKSFGRNVYLRLIDVVVCE